MRVLYRLARRMGFGSVDDLVAFATVIYGCALAYVMIVAKLLGVDFDPSLATLVLCVLAGYVLVKVGLVKLFRWVAEGVKR